MGLNVEGVRVDPRQPLDSVHIQGVGCIIQKTCVVEGDG